jgi:K+-transporting ATPase A subunit
MKKFLTTLLLLVLSFQIFAREQAPVAEESLYASGKIYVVVVCAAVILLGLIVFLFTLDRRLKKLEKNSDQKN